MQKKYVLSTHLAIYKCVKKVQKHLRIWKKCCTFAASIFTHHEASFLYSPFAAVCYAMQRA